MLILLVIIVLVLDVLVLQLKVLRLERELKLLRTVLDLHLTQRKK